MAKYIQQEDYLEAPIAVNGRAVDVSKDTSTRDNKIVIALLAIQTLVLVALLGGGFKAYNMIRDKTDQIDAVVSIVENPSALINQPELVHSLVYLMQNTTNVFFLGDSDGTLPSFANNVFQFDFGTWANDVFTFANAVTNSFLAQGNSSLCHEIYPCNSSSYQPVQCPDGRMKYCDWTGTVNCAVDSSCVAPSLLTGASIVTSVAERLSTWQAIQGSSAGTPALSNGIFRIDVIFDWLQAQMNSPKWQQAGVTCESFVQQARSIDWNGTYTDPNGRTRSWDANRQVRQVAGYFEQVCSGLATLSTQTSQKTTTTDDKHLAAKHAAKKH